MARITPDSLFGGGYGRWVDQNKLPEMVAHRRKADAAWDSYQKANTYMTSYLGGRTAGTQDEFTEWQRRAGLADAASNRWTSLTSAATETSVQNRALDNWARQHGISYSPQGSSRKNPWSWIGGSDMAMGKIPPGKGGSPGQPYEAPKEDPSNPWVPAPKPKLANLDDEAWKLHDLGHPKAGNYHREHGFGKPNPHLSPKDAFDLRFIMPGLKGVTAPSTNNETLIASNIPKPPDFVRDSLRRQYSGKDYTTEDKKNVVNWQMKQAKTTGESIIDQSKLAGTGATRKRNYSDLSIAGRNNTSGSPNLTIGLNV